MRENRNDPLVLPVTTMSIRPLPIINTNSPQVPCDLRDIPSRENGLGPSRDSETLTGSSILFRLPEDILTYIITEHVYEPDEHYHIPLSHACRRLREIILGLSSLWCSLNSCMLESEVEVFLSRSGNASLTVNLYKPTDVDSFWSFLRRMKEHTQRWRVFDFDFDDDTYKGGPSFYNRLSTELEKLELPRLTHLRLMYKQDKVASTQIRTPYFFADWTMPHLDTLALSGITSAFPVSMFPEDLTTLELMLNKEDGVKPKRYVSEVTRVLSAIPRLRNLHMVVGWGFATDHQPKNIKKVELNALRTMSIECANYSSEISNEALQHLLCNLHTPNLIDYSCSVRAPSCKKIESQQLSYLLLNDATTIQNLTLDVEGKLEDACPFEEFLSALSNLEFLAIRSACLPPSFDITKARMPPLRTITFSKCTFEYPQFLKSLKSAIKSGQYRPRFERFYYEDCEFPYILHM